MTGPEHYKEAERLCAGAITTDNPFPHLRPDELLAAAQVHALLALAAAAEKITFPPKTISLAFGGAEVIDR